MRPAPRERLLAARVADEVRRQAEVGAHQPRLGTSGQPVVFIEGDVMYSYPVPVWSAGVRRGALLQVGWVYASRIGAALRIDDLYIFRDLDEGLYLPALLKHLNLEAALFGLDAVEVVVGDVGDECHRHVGVLREMGYTFVGSGLMRKAVP